MSPHLDTLRLPDAVRFGREVCGELAESERREWWLANGTGAYAAGTIAGTLTRRYHGLLVAPVRPPLGRMLVVAKADATLVDGDTVVPLFSNRWAGDVLAPDGHRHIESFHLDGRVPVWCYAVGAHRIEMRIWMEHGADTTYVAWRLLAPSPSAAPRLRVALLINSRDHHDTMGRGGLDPIVTAVGAETLRAVASDHDGRALYDLTLAAVGGTLAEARSWIENFDLPAERERGLGDRDNHLRVAEADLALSADGWCGIVASLAPIPDRDLMAALARRQAHDRALLDRAHGSNPALAGAPAWIDQLVLAADSFLIARPLPGVPDGESVIAGYPWFGDWGRDTMIALPGLALATGRAESARRILATFAAFVDRGMLPNLFPGAGDRPEYNTADAALWFIEAWRAFVAATDDLETLRAHWPTLVSVIDHHRAGTRHGIAMDEADALLRAGEPGVQVTWMDAKVGDWVVTPRIGKPVEINALWYNAIAAMAVLGRRIGAPVGAFEALLPRIRTGFARFADPASGGLYDVIDGPDGDDRTVRPNQILAVSLPESPLDPALQRSVVALCGRTLLTSFGLRSLAPADHRFRPHYSGDVPARDGAYHNGPVWAWLAGHYVRALARVSGDKAAARALLAPFADHLRDAGLGTVSEIFDGAPPHRPRGAPAQAWSVAAILEAWTALATETPSPTAQRATPRRKKEKPS